MDEGYCVYNNLNRNFDVTTFDVCAGLTTWVTSRWFLDGDCVLLACGCFEAAPAIDLDIDTQLDCFAERDTVIEG